MLQLWIRKLYAWAIQYVLAPIIMFVYWGEPTDEPGRFFIVHGICQFLSLGLIPVSVFLEKRIHHWYTFISLLVLSITSYLLFQLFFSLNDWEWPLYYALGYWIADELVCWWNRERRERSEFKK